MRLAPLALPIAIALTACGATALTACGSSGEVSRTLADSSRAPSPLDLYDALEALIDAGKDTPADRAYAYDRVRVREEPTAAYALARAAITGRLVQARGMTAAHLVADVERYALRSREIDPTLRDGAATRLLGTLYVLAPAALLQHGDSEKGLELLDALTRARPDLIENHLRLAEALIALGDTSAAVPHLCRCVAARGALRPDHARLLDRLVQDADRPACPPAKASTEGQTPPPPR